jgi:hypothetical protein
MPGVVVAPTERKLVEIVATRTPGPPALVTDSRERTQRVRAALANQGFALPHGRIEVTVADGSPAHDLPVALSILLCDRSHRHLRRHGWIAWGGLRLDGGVTRGEGPYVGGLHPGPSVGRIWRPEDRLPEPEDDAVISLIDDIESFAQAWEVITKLVDIEKAVFEEEPTMQQ